MKRKDRHGDPVPFDVDYVSSEGKRYNFAQVVWAKSVKQAQKQTTSVPNPLPASLQKKGSINITVNVMLPGGELRGLKMRQVIGLNGEEVCYA